MNYNLFIKTSSNTYNVLDINESDLSKIIDAYKFGKETFFIKGKMYWLTKLREIQIYTFEHAKIKTEKDLMDFCKEHDAFSRFMSSYWLSNEILEKVGKRVTEQYINDEYGYFKEYVEHVSNDYFVDQNRIKELELIENSEYDLTKMLAFLREMNIAYSNNMYLSIPLLVRATIDHVPPIFKKQNFADICGSYGSKSFKASMNNLESSLRKIADSVLHTPIRIKEDLPNKTQVNFKHDLDVLLGEIVRINKH